MDTEAWRGVGESLARSEGGSLRNYGIRCRGRIASRSSAGQDLCSCGRRHTNW